MNLNALVLALDEHGLLHYANDALTRTFCERSIKLRLVDPRYATEYDSDAFCEFCFGTDRL